MKHYSRDFEKILKSRLKESPQFIQCVVGPRQVGKTSGVLNVLGSNFNPNDFRYFSAEEHLAGRFEQIPVHHWSFQESQKGFKLTFEQYLSLGGYPCSYSLISDSDRFNKYIIDSIFESVVNRDIFRFATIKKPALFRQTFILATQFPAQEVSYNKLLGQLQDAGNTDQIKHYLDLLSQAYLMRLIFKWGSSSKSRSDVDPLAYLIFAQNIARLLLA